MAILAVRKMRLRIFPSDIFDEHAWTMLLQLFVALADNETMPESILIKQVGMSPSTGQRWLTHLVIDRQITALSDGGDVTLTEDAINRMRAFLDEASLEAHEIEDQNSERHPGHES